MARTSLVDDAALGEEDDFGDGSFQLDISGISGFGTDLDATNDMLSLQNSQTLNPLNPSRSNSKLSNKSGLGSVGTINQLERKQNRASKAIPLENIMEQEDDDLPDFNSADELMAKPLPTIDEKPLVKTTTNPVPVDNNANLNTRTKPTGFDPIPMPNQPKAEPPKPSVSNFDPVPMPITQQQPQNEAIPTPDIPSTTGTRRLLTGGLLSRKNLLQNTPSTETKPEPKNDDLFGDIPFPALPSDKPKQQVSEQPQPVQINQQQNQPVNISQTPPQMQPVMQQNPQMATTIPNNQMPQQQIPIQANQNQIQTQPIPMQQNQPQMTMVSPMQTMPMQNNQTQVPMQMPMQPQQQQPSPTMPQQMGMMQGVPMQQTPQQMPMQATSPLTIQIPQQNNQFSPNGTPYGQPYYSQPQSQGQYYFNNTPSPPPYSVYPYSVQFPLELGFSSSLDRSIANFKRIFSSEFSSIIRSQNLQQQQNGFDFDDFTDKLANEISQIIEAPIQPTDIDVQNITRKVSTAIDENTKHVTNILSEAEVRNSQSADHHIQELKQLQEELDHLRTSFKQSSDTIIRELERERQNSAAIREAENNRSRELEQRLRNLKLRQIELDTRFKNQALEKDSFDRTQKSFEQKRRDWEEETLPKLYDDNSSVRRRIIDELSAFRTEVSTESFDELSMVINEGLKVIKDEGENLRNELMELEMANRWVMSRQAPPPQPQKRSPKRLKKSSVLDQTQEKLSKIRRQRVESMKDLSDQL